MCLQADAFPFPGAMRDYTGSPFEVPYNAEYYSVAFRQVVDETAMQQWSQAYNPPPRLGASHPRRKGA